MVFLWFSYQPVKVKFNPLHQQPATGEPDPMGFHPWKPKKNPTCGKPPQKKNPLIVLHTSYTYLVTLFIMVYV